VAAVAVLLSFADGFVLTAVEGAVGAIERGQGPFASWLWLSTLTLPVFFAAVLGALVAARRRFGPVLGTTRKVLAAALLIAVAGALVGTAEVGISAAFDYHLQLQLLQAQHSAHGHSAAGSLATALQRSLETDTRAVRYAGGVLLVADIVLVGWVVALRGGRIEVSRRRPLG
jgi:hypothetical protein